MRTGPGARRGVMPGLALRVTHPGQTPLRETRRLFPVRLPRSPSPSQLEQRQKVHEKESLRPDGQTKGIRTKLDLLLLFGAFFTSSFFEHGKRVK